MWDVQTWLDLMFVFISITHRCPDSCESVPVQKWLCISLSLSLYVFLSLPLCVWKEIAMKWKEYMKEQSAILWNQIFSIQGVEPHLHSTNFILYTLLSKIKKKKQQKPKQWKQIISCRRCFWLMTMACFFTLASFCRSVGKVPGTKRQKGVSHVLPD